MQADGKSKKDSTNKLGRYLFVSAAAINNVIEKQISNSFYSNENPKRIGELLLEAGIITADELDSAIRKQRVSRLKSCAVFADLSSTELSALSNKFTEVSVPKNEIFITQGENAHSMYLIADGRVEVFRIDNSGAEIHIAEVKIGDPIGEMAYFSREPRNAYARALEPTELLQIQYSDLTKYFENVPHVARLFTTIVEDRRKFLLRME